MWNYRSIYEYHKYIKPDIVSWIVKSYDIKLLRDKVKYISNESYFFSDTIKNNITCGKKDISNKTLETQVLIYNNLYKTLIINPQTPWNTRIFAREQIEFTTNLLLLRKKPWCAVKTLANKGILPQMS